MEVREINRICTIESDSALSDASKDKFLLGEQISFEHFVKTPVSFTISKDRIL